jgi:hypothetical protein
LANSTRISSRSRCSSSPYSASAEKPFAQRFHQFAALHLGVAEGDGRYRLVVAQQARDGVVALVETDLEEQLFDLAVVVLRFDRHFDRIDQEVVGGAADVVRVGGREQQGLAASGRR